MAAGPCDHKTISMATPPADPPPAVLRFAPSPNGRLHLGHALSALTNEHIAAGLRGRLLLRIEDIDPGRCRPEFEEGIHEDLAWLGLRFDGAVRRQSEHMADYSAALDRLSGMGLLYPCFCSRQEIRQAVSEREAGGTAWPRDPDGAPLYPGDCRRLARPEAEARIAAGAAHALRLDMERAVRLAGPLSYRRFDAATGRETDVVAMPQRWGDVVLARREVPTSYHLAVVVDDALQGVTHVVRGQDLEAATEIHVLLQHLLGLPSPLYHFHPLLLDDDGHKLAKSRASTSLAALRAEGASAGELRRQLGFT